MLIPMYFIIGIWGGERRLYASIKFVLYTLVGSLLMLVAILYLYVAVHDATGSTGPSTTTSSLQLVLSPHAAAAAASRAFALAFCIKVPLFPLHTWLPDAHVEAPTGGLGDPGRRCCSSSAPTASCASRCRCSRTPSPRCAPLLAIAGGDRHRLRRAGRLRAERRQEADRLLVGGAPRLRGARPRRAATPTAIERRDATQMLAHGISTGGLFLCIGVLYERRHTRRIDEFGGLAAVMPVLRGAAS